MAVLDEILEEEYLRSSRLVSHMEAELAGLPKGSLRTRKLKGHEYHYLNYRDGQKIKSLYVPTRDVAEMSEKIERRKSLVSAIKEQRQSQKQIIRALGRIPDVD